MSAVLEMRGDVGVIKLDDGKRNAVNHAFLDAVNAALDDAEGMAKCVVLMGREGTFSAGFDLKFFATATPEERTGLVQRGSDLTLRLLKYPMPVISACTGHGIAMGAFILLASDFRFGVSGDFRIGTNETQINMILPVFGFALSKERIPTLEKSRATIEGYLYTPEQAVSAGFLDEVVPADALEDRVFARAEELAKLNGKVFAGNRMGLRAETIEAIQSSSASLEISR